MMRREMRARRRLGANSRSTDVVVTPWADEYVPAPCADLPTYPPCHAGAGGRTYLPTPPLISQVGLPTMKKHKTQVLGPPFRCLVHRAPAGRGQTSNGGFLLP